MSDRIVLTYGSREIIADIAFVSLKRMMIKVYPPDGRVEVHAPLDVPMAEVMQKLHTKGGWILKQIDFFNSFKPLTPSRRFVNGETHLYLGRQYRLKIVADKTDEVKAYRGQLFLHTANQEPADMKKQLDKWYRQRATVIFSDLLGEILPRFKRYKVITPVLSVRPMQKRWGSCSPAGRITLNTELIKAPKGCMEYVITHELCHLVHPDHSRQFMILLNRMMPDWRKWKERLEQVLA